MYAAILNCTIALAQKLEQPVEWTSCCTKYHCISKKNSKHNVTSVKKEHSFI